MNFASRLLVTTSLTIKEIMYQSGFMNRSHFYKEFTKRMGVVPKDYRLHNKK
nr:helix-turn-helix domain-containing protein [Bacteroides ovatus]